MPSEHILNAIFGYVEISAENGFPERFINTCTAEGIPLWDMKKIGDRMTAKTTASGYKKIRSPARKSSMRVRMQKKVGLPFLIHRHMHRTGLFIGFIILLGCLIYLSQHVWIIEVNGNEMLTDTQITSAFEEAGLKIGDKINKLDLVKIENSAMLKLKDISWAAISIDGCVAQINVRELAHMPEIETHSGTANIIARKDGQLQILEVYRGSAATQPGQTVTKGDLLISGVTESKSQVNLFTDADGYAVAAANIKITTQTDKKITQLVPKSKKIWSISFLGLEIFPPKDEEEACYENNYRLKINGKVLPFGVNYRIYTVYEEKEKTMSKTEAKLMAICKYSLESYKQTLHAQIIDKKATMNETDNSIRIVGDYFCYENIGVKSDFAVEEIELTSTE